jgi:hypothetical protein
MTEEQYCKSLETSELQLSFGGKLNHFGIVLLFSLTPILLPAIHLISYLQGEGTTFKEGEIWIMVIPMLLAFLFYLLQKNRLKFHVVNTALTWSEIMILIENVSKELEWHQVSSDKKVFIAKTNPGFFSGSWGEQITILFDRDRVLINSICDLNRRSSVVSMGRNKENVDTLIERIKNADPKAVEA